MFPRPHDVNSELPLYLRGFKALEKEIALIKGRGTGDALLPYVPNYPKLAAQLASLTTDKRLQRIDKGIASTPLVDAGSFTAVRYDLEAVTFKSTTSRRLTLILGTLLGGVIAVILALIRHFTAQRKQTA